MLLLFLMVPTFARNLAETGSKCRNRNTSGRNFWNKATSVLAQTEESGIGPSPQRQPLVTFYVGVADTAAMLKRAQQLEGGS